MTDARQIDTPFAGELVPRHLPRAHRDLHRIDAEQTHAAQNKRKHVDVEIGRHGVAAGRDQPAVFRRLERRGENIAADRIDDTGPTRLFAAAGPNVSLASSREMIVLAPSWVRKSFSLCFSGGGDDVEAELGENRHRDAADTAGGAGDQNFSRSLVNPLAIKPNHAQRRRQSRRAVAHAVAQRQRLRHFGRPQRRHADVLAEAAGGIHAEIESRHRHLIADRKQFGRRVGDDPGRIDARRMRIFARHAFVAGRRQRVFIIERRVFDFDDQLAGRQIAERAFV